MGMKKLLFIIGTRPEAIKQAPVIKRFEASQGNYDCITVVTGQHREMLDQVLQLFGIKPKYDLNLMLYDQNLTHITTEALKGIQNIIDCEHDYEHPDMIFVQGDTTSTFIGALAGFYHHIPVAHVEAGLRTYDKKQPFPEEINRVLTSHLADIHFAPTERARDCLLREGISPDKIWVTGNTVIDALLAIVKTPYQFPNGLNTIFEDSGEKIILVTAHRRENHGRPLENICRALEEITSAHQNVKIVYPVHLSPRVQKTVYAIIGNHERIHLIPPLSYQTFVHAMKKSYLILTDSGGIQEEAPSLGKPVLLLRETTERPEAVLNGTVELVGTDIRQIVDKTNKLLTEKDYYNRIAQAVNPYGDGKACERILNIIDSYFNISREF